MRFVGRIVALLALCWLALVILGGLGVGPARHVPFGTALRPSSGPPPLRALPAPRQPVAADLVPAVPAAVAAARVAKVAAVTRAKARGRSGLVPGHPPISARGRSGTAPGHTTTTKTKGRSGAAPGQAKRSTTTTTTAATTTTTPTHGRGIGKLKH
jgi:hypothetical protein